MNRPIPLVVACVIGLLLGGIGLCGLPFAVLPYVADLGVPNPVIEAVKASTVLYSYMLASFGCGACMNVVMVACCIGAFFMKNWARSGLIAYSLLNLLLVLVGVVFNAMYMFPLLQTLGDEAMYGGIGGAVGGLCCGLFLPIMFLVVLNITSVKLAFAEASGAFIDEIYE